MSHWLESLTVLGSKQPMLIISVGAASRTGKLAERIMTDEFTFVTNNRVDFLRLFERTELHSGLIVLVPNVVPVIQRALFHAAIQYLAGKDMINSVIEVTLD